MHECNAGGPLGVDPAGLGKDRGEGEGTTVALDQAYAGRRRASPHSPFIWAKRRFSGWIERVRANRRHRRLRRQDTHRSEVSLRPSFPSLVLGVLSSFESTTNILSMSRNFSGASPGDWISQAAAARLRGVSRQAIASLIRTKRVQTLEIGGRLLVLRQEIEQFEPKKAGRRPKAGKRS